MLSVFVGWILIDRSGKHFGTILNFLRDGSVTLPEGSHEIAELYAEAKYYLVQGLVDSCEAALRKREKALEPICRVPLITSQNEEEILISNTTKVWLVRPSAFPYDSLKCHIVLTFILFFSIACGEVADK